MTSIEWLISEMTSKGFFKETITLDKILNLEYKAEEMHKQEIMKSYSDGFGNGNAVGVGISNPSWVLNEKEYYQETFVSNGTCGLLKDYHIVEANEMASSQTEISDKEVEKEIKKRYETTQNDAGFRDGCAWYREQLKNKQ